MGMCSKLAHLSLLLMMSRVVLGQENPPSEDLDEGGNALTEEQAIATEEDLHNHRPQEAKEEGGNEANPSLSIILDFAGAYFSRENRIHHGGHAPITNGPFIQGAELAASVFIDPIFSIDVALDIYHMHMEEIYLTTTSLPLNLQIRAGKFKSDVCLWH